MSYGTYALRRLLRTLAAAFIIVNLLLLLLAGVEAFTPEGHAHAWFQCDMEWANFDWSSWDWSNYLSLRDFDQPLCPTFPLM
jgi:hypothetical protein